MTKKGQPWVSSVVHKIRLQIAEDPSLNYEYIPVMGMKSFIQASLELLFGKHSQVIVENRVRRRALPHLPRHRDGDQSVHDLKPERDLAGSLALTKETPEAQRVQSFSH